MRKRPRRKLSRGKFAHPYPHTRRQREVNARVGQALATLLDQLGPERFMALVEQANESVPLPHLEPTSNPLPCE